MAVLFVRQQQGGGNGNVGALAAAYLWTSLVAAAAAAPAGGGAAALALLSLRQGWAADALACAACLRPRAEVRGGQRRLQAAPARGGAVS